MTHRGKTALVAIAVIAAGGLLSACAQTQLRLDPNFGEAVNQDLAAQIANPDPAWKGPPPPSSGDRAALAQKRYETNTVIPPPAESTSSVNIGNSSGGGGGGGGTSGTSTGGGGS